nr:hypothetical protein GCM10020093_087080 [Planobispora longispora]
MSLRARLLTGLLTVSTALLLTLSGVSVLVLHEHLLQRVDGQLRAATATAAKRIAAAPGGPLSQTLTGSTYAVAVISLATGRARLVNGDAPETTVVPHLVERLGRDRLKGYAAAQERFDLDPTGEYRLIARVAKARQGNRLVVVAVSLESVEDPIRRLVITELLTGGLLILLLALIGRMLITRGLTPLARIAGAAYAMASHGDLSVRMPEGASEVGRLGAAVNLLLERIAGAFRDRQASEERVRRFAADASHELRTPLSTIRGTPSSTGPARWAPRTCRASWAGSRTRRPGWASSSGRCWSWPGWTGARRSNRPRRIWPTWRATWPRTARRSTRTRWSSSTPPPRCRSSPTRRGSARSWSTSWPTCGPTPPGTVATVRLARPFEGTVLVEVHDDGPGMSREQAARAFDRFHRGEERVREGAGLGLSIVKAIAEAHGGRCWITSAPGAGTCVHVALPDRPPFLGAPARA